MGSGVEWLELTNIEKECCQLYEQYKGEEWVHPFDMHFAPVDPSLEFLLDNLMVGMTVSAPAVASTSDTAKHLVGALAVVRGKEWSKGCSGKEKADCEHIQEGPSTPKAVTGSVARGLATTLRSKGKGKEKAQKKDDKDIEETWSNTPLQQVGNNELEWLGKDLAWPTPLTPAALLADFNKRVAGVEQWFQRELEAAREELVVARAQYAVAKQTLATLSGYWHDCQAFLAWQENNIGKGDWEEEGLVDVPDDNADLDA
ncbi:hypothetical protein E4T56_gene18395 [Termitomyces sp. T112]|nr:hypothetical protein E4T56_gene18395 [Termitomyces sp. T112]